MNIKTTKRLLSLLLAAVLSLGLCTTAFAAGTDPITAMEDALTTMAGKLTAPTFGNEWDVFALARSGRYEKGDWRFEQYYTNLASYCKSYVGSDGVIKAGKSTENSRVIIALSAIGRDASSVGGCDLLEPYSNFDWVSAQGLNGPIFALIALDTRESYKTAYKDTREKCIKHILDKQQLSDGGWDLSASTSDPDMTAMAVQALAPYYKSDTNVKKAVDKAVTALSTMQKDGGSYASWKTINSESAAQVITACAALGINAATDERFVKGGKSAVDALLVFYNATEKAFHHTLTDKDGNATAVDGMATQQGTYALVAYERLLKNKTALYDMSDVKADCANGKHTFGEWKETAATCTEPKLKTRTCSVCGRSEFETLATALGHRTASGYSMSDTAHWLACAVCGAHVNESNHRYTGDQCAICGYHKLGGRIQVTELTALPTALKNMSDLDTLAKLQAQMLSKLQTVDKGIKRTAYQLFDVSFLIPDAAGGWADGTDKLPADGRITVLLPYPAGTGRDSHNFAVVHVFDADSFGKKAGGMEAPRVTETADGLQVTLTGLSPVAIGWSEIAQTDKADNTKKNAVHTADDSQMLLWISGAVFSISAGAVLMRKRRSTH